MLRTGSIPPPQEDGAVPLWCLDRGVARRERTRCVYGSISLTNRTQERRPARIPTGGSDGLQPVQKLLRSRLPVCVLSGQGIVLRSDAAVGCSVRILRLLWLL